MSNSFIPGSVFITLSDFTYTQNAVQGVTDVSFNIYFADNEIDGYKITGAFIDLHYDYSEDVVYGADTVNPSFIYNLNGSQSPVDIWDKETLNLYGYDGETANGRILLSATFSNQNPITANASGLVYSVTLSVNGLVDRESFPVSFNGTSYITVDNGTQSGAKYIVAGQVVLTNNYAPELTVDNSAVSIYENANDGVITGADADATDKDGDTVTFSLVNPPLDGTDNALFSINGNSGQVSLTTYGAAALDYETTKSYTLTVRASDGVAAHNQDKQITVNLLDVNEAPTVANAIPDQTAKEDSEFTFTVSATAFNDVDAGDGLGYSAKLADGSALPSWLSFNAVTRTFSGTPTNDHVGSIDVTVMAMDVAGLTVSDTFKITVQNTNDAPVGVADTLTATEDTATTFTASQLLENDTDVDTGDVQKLAIASVTSVSGGTPVLNADGTVTFTPTANFNGDATFTYTATDGNGGVTSETTVTVHVSAVNDAPTVLNAIADKNATEDSSFTFTMPSNTFHDVDAGDSLTYSAKLADGNALPEWLHFNSETLTFSGKPANGDVGTIDVKVTAMDVAGLTVSGTFKITVANTNDAPTVLNAIADKNATEDSEFSFTMPSDTFHDVDASDVLTYSAKLADGKDLPEWLHFNSETLTFSGTPTNDSVGTIDVKVTATDGSEASVSDTFAITVANVNDAPVVAVVDVTGSITEGETSLTDSGSVTFSDVDVTDLPIGSVVLKSVSGVKAALDSEAPSELTLSVSQQLAIKSGFSIENVEGNTNSGTVKWAYSVAESSIDFLAKDEKVTAVFTITVSDGHGGTDSEDVTVEITGTNDAPVINGQLSLVPVTLNSLVYEENGDFEVGLKNWNTTSGVSVADKLTVNAGSNVWVIDSAGSNMAILTPSSEYFSSTFQEKTGVSTETKTYITDSFYTSSGMTPTNYSSITTEFDANAGETFSVSWTYASTDYVPYNDGSVLTLVNLDNADDFGILDGIAAEVLILGATNHGTGNYTTGSYGCTGWETSTIVIQTTGHYRLGLSAFNLGDTILSPYLFVDNIAGSVSKDGVTYDPISSDANAPDAAGDKVELPYLVEGSGDLNVTGSITFVDVDATDMPVASKGTKSITALYTDGTPAALSDTQMAAIADAFTISTPGTNKNTGTVNWTYDVAETSIDFLVAGQVVTAVFTITVADGKGGTDSEDVTVTITGTNDAAAISGTSQKELTETNSEADLVTSGKLNVEDLDDPTTIVPQTDVTGSGGYGKFTIAENGAWSYKANSALDELADGTVYTDTLTVTTPDGTKQVLTVKITGTNDAAVITGTSTKNLTETNSVLTTGDTLSVTDPDSPTTFVAQTDVAGSGGYGKFTIGTNGVWSYTANTAHNEFKAGSEYTDTLQVTSYDGTEQVLTVKITGTNDAPVLNTSLSPELTGFLEGTPSTNNTGTLVSSLISEAVTDADADAVSGIYVTAVDNAHGTWSYKLGSGSWTAFDFSSNTGGLLLSATDSVQFVPANENWNGTSMITFGAWDKTSGSAGDYANISVKGGSSAFSAVTDSASITVTSVNDAPAGLDKTVTMFEDGEYTFSTADFGFSDTADGDHLEAVKITKLEAAGSLEYWDGEAWSGVTLDQEVSAVAIASGYLRFSPASNANKTGYANFEFKVIDDGGTSNDGVNIDQSANKITIDVTAVNDAPMITVPDTDAEGEGNQLTTAEDTPIVFSTLSGKAITVADPDGDILTAIVQVTEGSGKLEITAVNHGATLIDSVASELHFSGTVAQINAALEGLTYTPTKDWAGSSTLTIKTSDGQAIDTKTVDITVTPVNDAPVATTMMEIVGPNSSKSFDLFALTDAYTDAENDTLLYFKIITNPTNGNIEHKVDGTWVTVTSDFSENPLVIASDYLAVYRYTANDVATGTTDKIQWQVVTGPASDPQTSNTADGIITIVDPNVNDAPKVELVSGPGKVDEDGYTTITIKVSDLYTPSDFLQFAFGSSDNTRLIDGSGVTVESRDTTYNGNNVPLYDTIVLKLTPKADMYGSAGLKLGVFDGDKTGTIDLTLNVAPVNETPLALDFQSTLNEDGTFSFSTSIFADIYSDVHDANANTAVTIVTLSSNTTVQDAINANLYPAKFVIDSLPEYGTLTLDGVAITLTGTGQNNEIALADFSKLLYTPVGNYNGTDSFTWHAVDLAPTDGSALSTETRTASFEVTAVNDAPVSDADTLMALEDTTVTFNAKELLGNDTDVDGDNLTIKSVGSATNGTVKLNADGTVTFTPDKDFNGEATFTYIATDGVADTDSTTVKVTVASVNDAPVGVADTTLEATEDTQVTYTATQLLGNDSDVDGDSLIIKSVGDATNGTVTLNPDGTVTFTPDENFHGNASFKYVATDGIADSSATTVTVTVASVNDAPVGHTDTLTSTEDTPVTYTVGDLLGNDYDADSDTLTIASVTSVTGGTVNLNADGTVTFTPTENFNGEASFTYIATDGNGGDTESTTVTVTVAPVNDVPTVSNLIEDKSVDQGTLLKFQLPENTFSDVDSGDTLTYSATLSSGGNLPSWLTFHSETRTFTGIPSNENVGSIEVTVTAKDGSDASVSDTFTLTVVNANDAPVLNVSEAPTVTGIAEDVSADGNTGTTIADMVVNGSITDADGSAVDAVYVTAVDNAHGTWQFKVGDAGEWTAFNFTDNSGKGLLLDTSDSVRFVPTENWNGTSTITFGAWDKSSGSAGYYADISKKGLTSAFSTATDTASLTVSAVNDAPVNSVPSSQSVAEDGTLVFSGSKAITVGDSLDTALDGSTDGLTATVSVLHGTLTATTGGGATISTNGTSSVTISGTAEKVNAALLGLTYAPTANYNGADTLTIETSDSGNTGGGSLSDTDTVSITVSAVNDTPTNTVPEAQTVAEDGTLVFSGSKAITVGDSLDTEQGSSTDGLTATVSVLHGTVTATEVSGATITTNGTSSVTISGSAEKVNAALLGLTYAPTGNYNGADTLTVETSDSGNTGGGSLSDTDTVSITVTPVNDTPVSHADTLTATDEDTVVIYTAAQLLGNDTDLDGDTLTIASVTSVTGGTAKLNANGTVTFTPTANFNGDASFTYIATDGVEETSSATATVHVNAVNDAPTVPNPIADKSVDQDSELKFTVPSNTFDDVDGDTLTYSATGLPTWLNFDAETHEFSGTPSYSNVGTIEVTVTATDGTASVSDTFVITVVNTNDAPVGTADEMTATEDIPVTYTAAQLLGNDTDADSDTLTIKSVKSGTGGTVVKNANGTVTFTPTANYNGNASFSYIATDGKADTSETTVSITVSAVNDAPVNTVPSSQSIVEDSTLVFSGAKTITVSDSSDTANGGTNALSTTVSVLHGTLTATTGGAATISTNGTSSVTISGTAAQVNTALSGLTYAVTANYNGADTLTIATSDSGYTGTGGTLTDTDTVSITVSAVNDAPVNTVPGAQTMVEDGTLVFSGSNKITVSDSSDTALDGTDALTTTVSVLHGKLTATTGGTATIEKNGTSSVKISGTAAEVDAALLGLTYAPTANYNGADSLTVVTSDGGYTGTGGALSDTDVVSVTVTPVNDAPTTSNVQLRISEYMFNNQLVLKITQSDLLSHASDLENNTLTASNLTIATGSGSLYDNGDGTWNYTPGANLPTTFSYTITDNGTTNGVADHKSVAGTASLGTPYHAGYTLTLDVQHWNETPIQNVDVVQTVTNSDANGSIVIQTLVGEQTIQPSLSVSASDENSIDLRDPILILKSNAELTELSTMQTLAADFNKSGKVDLTDAIDILKYLAALTAPAPEWKFYDAVGATPITVDMNANKTVDVVGVLLGDVDGTWGL
jgi:VCBS repeat-containing protein